LCWFFTGISRTTHNFLRAKIADSGGSPGGSDEVENTISQKPNTFWGSILQFLQK
jgi:hypothetical protein